MYIECQLSDENDEKLFRQKCILKNENALHSATNSLTIPQFHLSDSETNNKLPFSAQKCIFLKRTFGVKSRGSVSKGRDYCITYLVICILLPEINKNQLNIIFRNCRSEMFCM